MKKPATILILVTVAFAAAAMHARIISGGRSIGDQTEVERDSLETMVRYLSILDSDPLTYRSRFTYREAELAEVADFLADRLRRYTDNAVERRTFTVTSKDSVYTVDSTYTVENIVGFIPGTGESEGRILITAHFDATASRSPGWAAGWATMPAPGADDNATGVAALMEAARVFGHNELPFGMEFVLFSAEELGKFGSIEYLAGCDSACADSILGVINLDMIGYDASDEFDGTIMTDFRSGWLADLLFLETLVSGGDAPSFSEIKPGPSNWDHASFWNHDPHIAAVTIAEPLDGPGIILYPDYHTVNDTLENVDFAQVEEITVYLVDFLARFALAGAELAMLPSDLMIMRGDGVISVRSFRAGEEITLWVRARSVGGANPDPGSGFTMAVSLENNRGTHELFRGEFEAPELLKARDVYIPLTLDERFSGENVITALITVYGFDDSPENNSSEESFSVEAGIEVLLSHSFQPNPITISFADAFFCVNLAAGANCIVEIYTLEGELVDRAYLGVSYGKPLEAGLNCFPCGDIFQEVRRMASGIYVYRIKLYSLDNVAGQYTGKFAVEN